MNASMVSGNIWWDVRVGRLMPPTGSFSTCDWKWTRSGGCAVSHVPLRCNAAIKCEPTTRDAISESTSRLCACCSASSRPRRTHQHAALPFANSTVRDRMQLPATQAVHSLFRAVSSLTALLYGTETTPRMQNCRATASAREPQSSRIGKSNRTATLMAC